MMMEIHESVDGITFAIQEIDAELSQLAPHYNRGMHREVIRNQVDELLDTRNDLTYILGTLAIDDEYERICE